MGSRGPLPEDHLPHYQFILTHYNTTNGLHLSRHPVPHQYHINSRYLGKYCLIPPTDAELMGGLRRTREGDYPQHLRTFKNKNLILTHYMIIIWWLHLMSGMGHYVIKKKLMTFGYTYVKLRLKIPPPESSIHSQKSAGYPHGIPQG